MPKHAYGHFSDSFDRLFSQHGSVIGNETWASKLADTSKSDRTPIELRQIADWIEAQPIWQKHKQSPRSNYTQFKHDNIV